MAEFKVNTTFPIKLKNYFVIAGDIISGKIEKGMYLNYKDDADNIIRLPIEEINFLDKRIKGKVVSEIALCIKADEKKYEILNKLHLKGRTFFVKNYPSKTTRTHNNILEITSFIRRTHRIHARIVTQGAHFLPGGIYSIKAASTGKYTQGYCVGCKSSKYLTFQLFGNPSRIEQGTRVKLEQD